MSTAMIIAAAISAFVITTPATAEGRGKPADGQSAGSGGRNASTSLLGTPSGGGEAQLARSGVRRMGGGGSIGESSIRETRSSGVVKPRQARGRSERAQCVNNLKQLGLGAH